MTSWCRCRVTREVERISVWLDDPSLVAAPVGFWFRVVAGPVFELAAAAVGPPAPAMWQGSSCPLCGGPAQVSVIAEESGEFMGGSPRSLVCTPLRQLVVVVSPRHLRAVRSGRPAIDQWLPGARQPDRARRLSRDVSRSCEDLRPTAGRRRRGRAAGLLRRHTPPRPVGPRSAASTAPVCRSRGA